MLDLEGLIVVPSLMEPSASVCGSWIGAPTAASSSVSGHRQPFVTYSLIQWHGLTQTALKEWNHRQERKMC